MTSANPWKMIYLARRNPALSAEAFAQAWREHSALGRQCQNVQDKVISVTQCCRLLDRVPNHASVAYDGVNLLVLRDRQAADDIWTDPETLAIMRPDEPRVFDGYVRNFTMVAREHSRQGVAGGNAVLVAFLKRANAIQPSVFTQAFATSNPDWPTLRACVVNLTEPGRPQGYDFDAVVEWWFDDEASLRQTFESCPLSQALPAHQQTVCEPGTMVFMATCVTHRRP